MLIKYRGGRSIYEVSLNRVPYYFTPENNMTAEIRDQNVINYIFSLPNRAEFEVVEEIKKEIPVIEEKPKKNKCDICGFIAKTEQGLIVHSIKHKKGRK